MGGNLAKGALSGLLWLVAGGAVLVLLVGICVPHDFLGGLAPRRDRAAKDLKAIKSVIDVYALKTGACPSGPDPVVQLLNAEMLRERPVDPWGNYYGFEADSAGSTVTVLTLGGDRATGGEDEDADQRITVSCPTRNR